MDSQLSPVTRSLVDRDRRIDNKLEQPRGFLLEQRISNRLNCFENKIDELKTGNKVLTGPAPLLGNISIDMVRIALLSAPGELQSGASNASQVCREFGEALATTSAAFLGLIYRVLGGIRDNAQENQLALIKQIKWYLPARSHSKI